MVAARETAVEGGPVPLLARFFRRVADVACACPRGAGGGRALPLDADFLEGELPLSSSASASSSPMTPPSSTMGEAGGADGEVSLRWRFPGVDRLVAVGDLHGDAAQAREALVSAGVLDPATDRWCGGETVLVQVGDVLDRGGDEVELYYLLERLRREARAAGGAVHVLMGNHESLNIGGRLRYASREGGADFRRYMTLQGWAAELRARSCPSHSSFQREVDAFAVAPGGGGDAMAWRRQALRPGAPFVRRFLADNPVVLLVGSTLFVHGGVLPDHLAGGVASSGDNDGSVHRAQLGRLNEATRRWARGAGEAAGAGGTDFTGAWFKGGWGADAASGNAGVPPWLRGASAPVWARHYSAPAEKDCACDALGQALRLAGAARQVVGHTIQAHGITEACGGMVYRVDVGMSKGCIHGAPQALEIRGEGALGATPTIAVIGTGGARMAAKPAAAPAVLA